MSLKDQLKSLASPITASFSIDALRRKSLVYERPQSIDTQTCYRECLRAFEKLCEADQELCRFGETLFSAGTLQLQLHNLHPVHKAKVDEQISLFFYLISAHLRTPEFMWVLEWLVHKFQVHLHYVDEFMMLLLPHCETGLFAKCIQLLDFKNTSSDWQWLQPFAKQGLPLSRQVFLKACCAQPSLIPFIGTCICTYAKYESVLRLNRFQFMGTFFVSTMSGICDLSLSEDRMEKIVQALQGTIRRGLRSPAIPAFQSASSLVIARLTVTLKLDRDLVLDWIDCLIKKCRDGCEWENISLINIVMRTQGIVVLPDDLVGLYENLSNTFSPLERALLEKEENKNYAKVDLNAITSASLAEFERVQKATMVIDSNSLDGSRSCASHSPTLAKPRRMRTLTVKHILKMTYADLFSTDPELHRLFEIVHYNLGNCGICLIRQDDKECSCITNSVAQTDIFWLTDFLIAAVLSFTLSPSIEQEQTNNDVTAVLKLHQCKAAFETVVRVFEAAQQHDLPLRHSPRTRNSSLPNIKNYHLWCTLDEAFLCVLSALLHPVGDVRVGAYDLLKRYIAIFGKLPYTADCHNVNGFLSDVQGDESIISESTRQMLQGDTLSVLSRTSPVLVQSVFRSLCRQPLKDTAYSQMCWYTATQLMNNDILPSIVGLVDSSKSPENDTIPALGWKALLQLIRYPQFARFEVVRRACIDKFDALTLPLLASLGKSEIFGITSYEREFLDALIELAGSQAILEKNVLDLFVRLSLKVKHYVFCLAKLEPVHVRTSQSLFARVMSARKNTTKLAFFATTEEKRLRSLKILLVALAGDLRRLSALVTTAHNNRKNYQASTPLSSAVCRLKNRFKTCCSSVRCGISNGEGNSPDQKDSLMEGKNCDLVFPLNSHLLACISAETRFQREATVQHRLDRRQSTSVNSSVFLSKSTDEEDEGVHDIDTEVIPLSDDEFRPENIRGAVEESTIARTVDLREQTLACVFEALVALTNLFAEGNNLTKAGISLTTLSHFLMSTPSVAAAMDTIFQCSSVFEESPSIQRQVMLCLIEMASLFPVVLCKNLVTLVQWAGGSDGVHRSMFLKLDNTHNLALLGRLISVAVPALVRVSRHRLDAGLQVLNIFVRGLPDLPAHLPRRSVALYAGLLRGLAQVVVPIPVSSPSVDFHTTSLGVEKCVAKRSALQGWLWIAAAFFLNTDWPSQETADLVVPLLTDLFNQFDLSLQLSSWQQCFEFFIRIFSNPDSMRTNLTPLHKAKRSRLEMPMNTSHPKSSHSSEWGLLLKHLSCADTPDAGTSSPPSVGRKRPLVKNEISPNIARFWSLLSNLAALFSGLLESSGHHRRQKEAIDHNSEATVQQAFGTIVQLTVQLLFSCSSFRGPGDSVGRKDTINHLQSILIKMNDLISNEMFVGSVAHLMSTCQSSITKRALELLLAKLENLTLKCPPATTLLTTPHALEFSPHLEASLKNGLSDIFDQLSSDVGSVSSASGADKGLTKVNYLRLCCLRKLAQLLCSLYPDKLLKTLDALISNVPSRWWPLSPGSVDDVGRIAVDAADARSMACLFAFECLARLPSTFTSLLSVSFETRIRVRNALRFALNHSLTACRLADRPMGSTQSFTAGKFHSREQHLQAGLTLLLGAFEFGTRKLKASPADPQADTILPKLGEEEESVSHYKGDKNVDVPSEPLDVSLLAFVFRTTHLDLRTATQMKADRSGKALKQSTAIIRRLRNRLISLPESLNLLKLASSLLKDATVENDPYLLSGGLEFVSRHADHVFSIAARSDVDMDSSRPGEGLPNSLETAYTSEPLLIWRLLRLALECHPTVAAATSASTESAVVEASSVARAALLAGTSLLAAMSPDHRLQLVGECLRYLIENKPDVCVVMTRMESFFVILERLSAQIPSPCFVSLVKNANLVNLFVCCLSLLANEQKSKHIRKLAVPLELPHLLDCFSAGITKASKSAAGACARGALAAIAAWLRAESQLAACLDTAGTDSVLALPQALVKLLDVSALGLTEVDLVPCVAAFLSAVGGDEALLRPLGTCLCSLATRSTHWRTRLACLRLLKQIFDTLLVGDHDVVRVAGSGDLGLAACLVPDTLVALSEALEDDRAEVEAAANRLFADLEAAGATVQSNG